MNPNTQLLILHGIQLFSLLLIGIFIYVMVKEPRTLWSGVSFLFALAGLGILFLLLIFRYSDWLQAHTPIRFLLLLLMILFMLAVVLFPLLLVLTFFIQGIQVLRREGLRPQNLLSLLFAILLFAYLIFWPQLGDWQSNFAGRMIYAIVGLWIVYGLLLFAIYAISALLNLIHRRDNQNFDYIVVLGAGIRGERVTPLLAARLDRGIALLKKNKKALLILSGGQGPGERGHGALCAVKEGSAGKNTGRKTIEKYETKSGIFQRTDGANPSARRRGDDELSCVSGIADRATNAPSVQGVRGKNQVVLHAERPDSRICGLC